MSKKDAQVANFNIVFGDEEKPMLDYFDTVIYPAMTAGISKTKDDNMYLFMNIEVTENREGTYILTGILVKKTTLEIKSDLTADGILVEKDEHYSTAPFSVFAINLLNHRMIFMPNQKGSPTMVNFRSTVRYVIDYFINETNKELDEDDKLEDALINVVGIPSITTMDELLKDVAKINSLTLRFYPLNGDIDYTEVFGVLSQDIRDAVGSKSGEVVYRSPKKIDEVKNLLVKAAGTIAPILKVVTIENNKVTLRDNELSEKYELEVSDDTNIENSGQMLIGKMSGISALNVSSDEHKEIYDRNKKRIIPFVKKVGEYY